MRYLALLLLLAAPSLADAQPSMDCDSDQYFRGLMRGQVLTAPCDSMVVLNKKTFERINTETHQAQQILERSEETRGQLEAMFSTQQEIVDEQQQYITALQNHDANVQAIADSLSLHLETSIQNTERAISIARTNKVMGILLGGAAGILVGALVF